MSQSKSSDAVYPDLRHIDTGCGELPAAAPEQAEIAPPPRGLLPSLVVLVAFAALGYIALATPTVAEAPAPEAEAKTEAAAGEAPAGGQSPAMPISVAEVLGREVIEYKEFSGRLRAVEDVHIRPRVSGMIDAVHFNEGDVVEKGSKLFTIDLRPFQANLNRMEALVVTARAALNLAASDLKRARSLFKDKAISARELDERINAHAAAEAALKAAEAQKELAQLDLEYAEVKAPITGRVGRPDITVGNTVRSGEDVLTTMQSTNPIYADFDIDEQTYLHLMKSVRVDNSLDQMTVDMALADETDFMRKGRIKSFDNQLGVESGTIRVRAEFANADGLLTPGLFARIRLGGADKQQAIIINDAAVSTDQSKRFVYVVDAAGNVQYRQIILGPIHPEGRIVEDGLQAGERIIVNGLMRARPGMQVSPMIVDMQTLQPAGGPPAGMQPPAGMGEPPAQ